MICREEQILPGSMNKGYSERISTITERLRVLDSERAILLDELSTLNNMRSQTAESAPTAAPTVTPASYISNAGKLALFRRLFRGRDDVYAIRWEDAKSGRTGYKPACRYDYRNPDPVTGKPARIFQPLNDIVILNHLRGADPTARSSDLVARDCVVGVYPLLQDESCWFLAADFDKQTWRQDAVVYAQTARSYGVQAVVERSRSGNGAHVWIFFDQPVVATLARKLGAFFLTQTMKVRPEIGLDSYDRFFPNQDTMPSGGFGNLIALPLQRQARRAGNSMFVDDSLVPYVDQIGFLSSVQLVHVETAYGIVEEAQRQGDVLGVRQVSLDDEFDDKPWTLPPSQRRPKVTGSGDLPESIEIVLANQVFIPKQDLPTALVNELVRLAAFQNPEFYKAQAMRFSTFDKPRIVACAENFPKHVALPRGCLDEATDLFTSLGVEVALVDETISGSALVTHFQGELRDNQRRAAEAMLKHDFGVLAVPTAFGKTVIAAFMIAERGVSTLILVDRKPLLEQWKQRLSQFLDIDPKLIGQIGGGKNRPTGSIDLATIQTLNRKGVVNDVVANYGHLIVDECHHLSAYSFERVARASKARYILGLSATPARRDGHHPIIFMQCGPIRFHIDPRVQAAIRPFEHRVVVRPTSFVVSGGETPPAIQTVYGLLAADEPRNNMMVQDVVAAVVAGRSPLVLTERTEHVDLLAEAIKEHCSNVFILRGGTPVRERRAIMDAIKQVPADAPRVLVGTGRYIGEGFDDARLDTLFLALPISWKGALAQYAGRLHREYDSKREVIVYDYVDEAVPMLARMFGKRKVGYRAIGYRI